MFVWHVFVSEVYLFSCVGSGTRWVFFWSLDFAFDLRIFNFLFLSMPSLNLMELGPYYSTAALWLLSNFWICCGRVTQLENKIGFSLILLQIPFQLILNCVSQTYLIIRTILGALIKGVDSSAPTKDLNNIPLTWLPSKEATWGCGNVFPLGLY